VQLAYNFIHTLEENLWAALRALEFDRAPPLTTPLASRRYDADLELFHKVLNGQLSEAVYLEQMAMLVRLKALLAEWAAAGGARAEGCAPRALLLQGLRRLFPIKSPEAMAELAATLKEATNADDEVS
jgi:hypothetical protein